MHTLRSNECYQNKVYSLPVFILNFLKRFGTKVVCTLKTDRFLQSYDINFFMINGIHINQVLGGETVFRNTNTTDLNL